MKQKINLLMLLSSVAAIFIVACSNDDDNNASNSTNVPSVVSEAFTKQFPNATNVKWTEKKNYHVATFDLSTKSQSTTKPAITNEAWYNNTGVCSLSELEISKEELEKSYPAIFATWNKMLYLTEGYLIDDIDLLQRGADSKDKVVKIEIEKGELECELYFTLDGFLAKDIIRIDDGDEDEDENLPCPQELTNYINQNYKDAIIVDFEQDDATTKMCEVEILTTTAGIILERELSFNDKFEFVSSEIDIDDDEFVKLMKQVLTDVEISEISKQIGVEDINDWYAEFTENKDGEIIVNLEDNKGEMIPILILSKDLQPKK